MIKVKVKGVSYFELNMTFGTMLEAALSMDNMLKHSDDKLVFTVEEVPDPAEEEEPAPEEVEEPAEETEEEEEE